jgi:hypothetical protein
MSEPLESHEPWVDPIVAEVRAARKALLADANFDLHVLCERLREREQSAGRKIVHRKPRRVARPAGDAA